MAFDFTGYETGSFYDEMFDASGQPHPHARMLYDRFRELSPDEVGRLRAEAEAALLNMGITFTVYKEESGIERIFPFDLLPRVVGAEEWTRLETGLKQRLMALNLFLKDIYHDQRIVKEGVLPRDLVESASGFCKRCSGWSPPRGIYTHVAGIDLVRDGEGEIRILEDNLRTPSGVSYVLENRNVLKRIFPRLFKTQKIRPVDDYPSKLLETLLHIAPQGVESPVVAVMTPGIYNSAYFEHSFLAREMGVQLVEGRDLVVDGGYVKMRTTRGLERVDVIYRRVDDDFMDPEAFREDSVLGVPGIMDAYMNGKVAIANAFGNGIADDKVIYAFVPAMIRFYLGEDPILPNVDTFVCHDPKQRQYVLANLDKLVVKSANESGGYGMLIGPHATQAEREDFARRIEAEPRTYIAQPTLQLSRVPTIVGDHFEGRHVDLRPYILYGEEIHVLPGGLTRVALKKGSLVVNSSQGGGSKDTWVLSGDDWGNGWGMVHAPSQSQTQGASGC